jgi:hypothetical protein
MNEKNDEPAEDNQHSGKSEELLASRFALFFPMGQ